MTAQELKNSILQYAVQGKLVPQDPTDEPASVLLERIKSEKAQLIKDKKIKAEKPLPPITEEEIPFEIPESWVWVRLNDICEYIQRGKSPVYSDEKKIPVISQKCVQWSGFDIRKSKFITKESFEAYSSERILKNNDLLWNSTGLGTLGRVAIYKSELNTFDLAVADSHVTVVRAFDNYLNIDFLFNYLSNPSVQSIIEQQSVGSTKQIELATSTIKNYLFPLPPLAEQQRIVAKIEELMPLVEEYDKAEKELTDLNAKFPEQIKKSVLQYAIQGKLVPQSGGDEPASELLKRIKTEKQQLIKEKKIKAEKPLPPITDEEIPFEIPENWVWVRLGEICKLIHYGYTASAESIGNARLLRITDIQQNKVIWENVPFCTVTDKEYVNYGLNNRDILIARTGGTIGKTYIVRNLNQKAVFASYLIRAIPSDYIYENFLKVYLESPHYWNQLLEKSNGTGQPNVNGQSLMNLVIALPPLAEQQRIVEKVEEVLGVCEGLKA